MGDTSSHCSTPLCDKRLSTMLKLKSVMVFWTADFLTRFLDSRSRLFRDSAPVGSHAQQMNVRWT